jgi:hypothetical protein
VSADVEWRVLSRMRNGNPHRGRVIDLSSTGLLLQCTPALQPGLDIELTIQWPASQGEWAGLRLHAFGQSIRADEGCTALKIDRSEFRFYLRS